MIPFYLKRIWYSRRWLIGSLAFAAVFAIGLANPRERHATFLPAWLLAFALAFDFQIARDRQRGFESLLSNFIDSRLDLFYRWIAAIFASTAFLAFALLVSVLVGHDFSAAMYRIAFAVAVLLLLVPFSYLVETILGVTVPFAVASFIALGAFAFAMIRTDDATRILRFTGLGAVESGRIGSLSHFAGFAAVCGAIAGVLGFAAWTFLHRRFRITSANEHKRS